MNDVITKAQRRRNFEEARKLAMTLQLGRVKRAKAQGTGLAPSTFSAMVTPTGERFVVGDSMEDIPKPDCFLYGRPAQRIKNFHTPWKDC